MRKPLMLTTALASLALATTACGGSDSATQQSAAAARTLDRMEQICHTWNAAVSGRAFPVDNFDPQHPAAAELPAVGAYFAPAVKAEKQALASIRALTPPPELSRDIQIYASALAKLVGVAGEQVAAARAADPQRFAATLDDADARIAAVGRAANRLAVKSCRAG